MMYAYGKTSRRRRDECHPDIVVILDEVIKIFDASVLCGKRGKEEQSLAFNSGKSKVEWPDSNHNVDSDNPKSTEFPNKSIAFDLGEWHSEITGGIDWGNKEEFWENGLIILALAKWLKAKGRITHDIRMGTDWDMDGIRVDKDPDEHFFDGPHFELVGVS